MAQHAPPHTPVVTKSCNTSSVVLINLAARIGAIRADVIAGRKRGTESRVKEYRDSATVIGFSSLPETDAKPNTT
jgi:hypothetical protein